MHNPFVDNVGSTLTFDNRGKMNQTLDSLAYLLKHWTKIISLSQFWSIFTIGTYPTIVKASMKGFSGFLMDCITDPSQSQRRNITDMHVRQSVRCYALCTTDLKLLSSEYEEKNASPQYLVVLNLIFLSRCLRPQSKWQSARKWKFLWTFLPNWTVSASVWETASNVCI